MNDRQAIMIARLRGQQPPSEPGMSMPGMFPSAMRGNVVEQAPASYPRTAPEPTAGRVLGSQVADSQTASVGGSAAPGPEVNTEADLMTRYKKWTATLPVAKRQQIIKYAKEHALTEDDFKGFLEELSVKGII